MLFLFTLRILYIVRIFSPLHLSYTYFSFIYLCGFFFPGGQALPLGCVTAVAPLLYGIDPQSSQAQLVCWSHRERTELDQGPGPGRCFYSNPGFEIHVTNTQGLLLISDAKTEVRKVGRGN